MRADELNDERERDMDAMTDEVRRQTAERDAAVKAKEEAEAKYVTRISWDPTLQAEIASLRAQLAEAREREGRIVKAMWAGHHALSTLIGIVQLRGIFLPEVTDPAAEGLEAMRSTLQDLGRCEVTAETFRAALSPSPEPSREPGARLGMVVLDEVADVPAEVWAGVVTPSPASGIWPACRTCPHPARCAGERVCTCHTACPHPAPSPASGVVEEGPGLGPVKFWGDGEPHPKRCDGRCYPFGCSAMTRDEWVSCQDEPWPGDTPAPGKDGSA